MLITKEIFSSICDTIGCLQPEQGGLIGGSNSVVTSFFFDTDAVTTKASYIPSINQLNNALAQWKAQNIDFLGIIHSHGHRDKRLSARDISFARKILQLNSPELKDILFPLVLPAEGNDIIEIIPYRISPDAITVENLKITNKL